MKRFNILFSLIKYASPSYIKFSTVINLLDQDDLFDAEILHNIKRGFLSKAKPYAPWDLTRISFLSHQKTTNMLRFIPIHGLGQVSRGRFSQNLQGEGTGGHCKTDQGVLIC